MSKLLSRSVTFGALLLGIGCADMNSPYYPSSNYPSSSYPSGGYNDPYYGGGYNDRYDDRRDRDRERDRREREELENERRRIDEERRRLAEERDRNQHRPQVVPLPPPPQREHCPSGFQETNDKCSKEERKRGCRDIKMPGGTRCIDR